MFKDFMKEHIKGYENCNQLTLENIYDITSLTSDYTLEGLFHKFELVKHLS